MRRDSIFDEFVRKDCIKEDALKEGCGEPDFRIPSGYKEISKVKPNSRYSYSGCLLNLVRGFVIVGFIAVVLLLILFIQRSSF